jgi:pyruvate dehydrogenase E1 component beta subunit
MVPFALLAADTLASGGIDVEVLDLRTLVPFDGEAVLASVARTGRLVVVQEAPRRAGFGAEVAAMVAERAAGSLRAPIRRVGALNAPLPMAPALEREVLPQVDWIVRAAREAVGATGSTGS